MPPDTPLWTVVTQVISHTPRWVWGLLALITVLGLKQLGENVVTRTRVVLVPVALGAYSLWGVMNTFGIAADVFTVWVIGMALSVTANQWIGWPQSVRVTDDGRFALQGSVLPLLAMWAVFAVRYVSAVTLVFHPGWSHGTLFSLAMPMVYGALSGIFLARSVRILRSGAAAPSGALASLA